jgi:hypothetical protein
MDQYRALVSVHPSQNAAAITAHLLLAILLLTFSQKTKFKTKAVLKYDK